MKTAANLFRSYCYKEREKRTAGILCAGWDAREGGQVSEGATLHTDTNHALLETYSFNNLSHDSSVLMIRSQICPDTLIIQLYAIPDIISIPCNVKHVEMGGHFHEMTGNCQVGLLSQALFMFNTQCYDHFRIFTRFDSIWLR